MQLTQDQVKGRIKTIAKTNNADARVLMRIFMMERFLERVSESRYADTFIIKGGILVTSMIGVAMRSTMDVDASVKNINLSEEDVLPIIRDICDIDLGDGISFLIKDSSRIMDEMEYPGLRFTMDAFLGEMVTPIKIDISTGDIITPGAVRYEYKLMLEDRSISLWSYNLETILAEKLQTILARGLFNTRMRDYYDVFALMTCYANRIDTDVLHQAFTATCEKRATLKLLSEKSMILDELKKDAHIQKLWSDYQRKYDYASEIEFSEVMVKVERLLRDFT